MQESHRLVNSKKSQTKIGKSKSERAKAPIFKKPGVSQEQVTEPINDGTGVHLRDPTVPVTGRDGLGPKKVAKDEDKTQMKIKKSRITKPGAARSTEKTRQTMTLTKKLMEPAAFSSELPIGTQAEDAQAREEFRELCSEKAIPLRKEWTPVKDTAGKHLDDVASSEAPVPSSVTPSAHVRPATCFGKLLGDFGFAQKADGSVTSFETTRQMNVEAMIKRRKIELVNAVCAAPPVTKLRRSKSLKKKPQTVTSKATAPFTPVDPLTTPSLRQCFGAPVAGSAPSIDQENHTQTPVTTRRKLPTKTIAKPKSRTAKGKKQSQPILLSPESAMKTAKDQELLFGTSSQLAREESPTLLKNLQEAMKESESIHDEWGPAAVSSHKFKPYNSLALTRTKDLWSVASRDFDGTLLNPEVVDLSDTPKQSKTLSESARIMVASATSAAEPNIQGDYGARDVLADIPCAPLLKLGATPVLQQEIQELELAIPKSVAEAVLKKRPKSRFPVEKAAGTKPASDQMPNYKGFTDAQLRKNVASYGFKSIKKREAMIVLLERCWESKVAMALQEVPVNMNPPQSAINEFGTKTVKVSNPVKKRGRPPKAAATRAQPAETTDEIAPKPRGRPRKDSTTTTCSPKSKRKRKSILPNGSLAEAAASIADEIYDSSPPTPSPPRRYSPPKSPSQLPISPSLGNSATTVTAPDNADRMRLFESICKAVTAFPPTGDPKNLTFHEKMLMYEPVVLEDLTIWLNAEGLSRVGEDDEVSPALVKEWCEERSVCCLWMENLRGGARSRY